jgi:hypothetical protein
MQKIIMTLLLLMPLLVAAQPGMPDNPTPIDGGLSILLAAGIAYGAAHKYKQKTDK